MIISKENTQSIAELKSLTYTLIENINNLNIKIEQVIELEKRVKIIEDTLEQGKGAVIFAKVFWKILGWGIITICGAIFWHVFGKG